MDAMRIHHDKTAAGFTLVEVLVAVFICGVGVAAVLSLMGGLATSTEDAEHAAHALALAQRMLAEINAAAFEDPDQTPSFGREAGESQLQRSQWDDVDDFNGHIQSPPLAQDRVELSDYTGYGWAVFVQNVLVDNPDTAQPDGDTDAKRITVIIFHNTTIIRRSYALRFKGGSSEDRQ